MVNGEGQILEAPTLVTGLASLDIDEIVRTQLAPVGYWREPEDLPPADDLVFTNNRALWDAVIEEHLRANVTITLNDFLLFEWFPRAPGIFHTPEAEESRLYAQDFKQEIIFAEAAGGTVVPPALRPGKSDQPDYMQVYNPYGKIQMLNGGVGAIRLKPKRVADTNLWFMSASSTATCHEGFPVALPDDLYDRFIDQIKSEGAAPCVLVGKLKFVPEAMESPYASSDIPQLYLLVEEAHATATPPALETISPKISVAVSFISEYEGYRNMYASYVTLYPGERGALGRSAEWLDAVYVQGMYQGKIVTDFDEHRSRFQNAPLSLDRVMTGRILKEDLLSQLQSLPNVDGNIHFHFETYEFQITNSSGFNIGPHGRVDVLRNDL